MAKANAENKVDINLPASIVVCTVWKYPDTEKLKLYYIQYTILGMYMVGYYLVFRLYSCTNVNVNIHRSNILYVWSRASRNGIWFSLRLRNHIKFIMFSSQSKTQYAIQMDLVVLYVYGLCVAPLNCIRQDSMHRVWRCAHCVMFACYFWKIHTKQCVKSDILEYEIEQWRERERAEHGSLTTILMWNTPNTASTLHKNV